MSSLALRGLRKSFGELVAVDGLDLEVEGGQITALLGPSGCGKTTVLRLIAGFERPDAGAVEIGAETVAGNGAFVAPERRRVGIVFQDYALFPHYDVAGNIAYALPRGEGPNRVDELLALVGLAGAGGRAPHELSGGEQQRVALARALAAGPEAILLDEPFSNLDASLRARMRSEVASILRDAGVTALFVTHDQEEALTIADTVAVMRAGRLEQVGTPEEVYGRPATHWAAEFLGEAEVLPATSGDGWVECELARLPIDARFTGPADLVVRPESIGIGSGPAPRGADQHGGIVVQREFYGHDQLVHVELGSGLRLRSRQPGFPAWHLGDRVHVWLDGPANVLPRRESPAGLG